MKDPIHFKMSFEYDKNYSFDFIIYKDIKTLREVFRGLNERDKDLKDEDTVIYAAANPHTYGKKKGKTDILLVKNHITYNYVAHEITHAVIQYFKCSKIRRNDKNEELFCEIIGWLNESFWKSYKTYKKEIKESLS